MTLWLQAQTVLETASALSEIESTKGASGIISIYAVIVTFLCVYFYRKYAIAMQKHAEETEAQVQELKLKLEVMSNANRPRP